VWRARNPAGTTTLALRYRDQAAGALGALSVIHREASVAHSAIAAETENPQASGQSKLE
jgi:hypothetical protein